MTNAYRDDLEAALDRTSDLEHEVEQLRRRNAELESIGETDEARENARRLAAALEREHAERQQQHQREIDDAHWSEASREESRAARAANAALKAALTTSRRPPTTQEQVSGAVVLVILGIVALIAQTGRALIRRVSHGEGDEP